MKQTVWGQLKTLKCNVKLIGRLVIVHTALSPSWQQRDCHRSGNEDDDISRQDCQGFACFD